MAARALRRAAPVALLATLLFALGAAVAYAVLLPTGPAIVVGAADYTAGTVHVSVDASTGLSAVRFEDSDGTTLGVVTSPAGPTADVDVPVRADMTVVAIGYDSGGNPVWRSSTPLKLSTYAPGKPTLAIAACKLVGPQLTAKGQVTGGTTTSMTLLVRGASVWSGPVTVSSGTFSLPWVPLQYGRSSVAVRAENGFGRNTSASVLVYDLGSTLGDATFILVDKSDLELYRVYGRIVTHVFPVAIGTPATPTHTGIFKLGPWRPSSGAWGPRRMALLKKVGKNKYRSTGYYIHGTNDPSSIGTEASHGCVRMYSKDAIKLSKMSRWFTVQIRE